MRTPAFGYEQHQRPPSRFDRTVGMLGQLQGLNSQQDESELVRQRVQQMQQQTAQQDQMNPMEQQLAQEKLKQLIYENSPEQHNLQHQIMQGQASRYDQLPDILQAGGYLQDPALLDYILKKKGYLDDDFNRHPASQEDLQLQQGIQQYLDFKKGAR